MSSALQLERRAASFVSSVEAIVRESGEGAVESVELISIAGLRDDADKALADRNGMSVKHRPLLRLVGDHVTSP